MAHAKNIKSTTGLASKALSSPNGHRALPRWFALATIAACSFSPTGVSAQLALEDQVAELETLVAELEALTQHVEVEYEKMDGLAGPHVIFEGANVHVRSGSGTTGDGGALRGLGNLVVGYNIDTGADGWETRTGSHNLVVGDNHTYSSFAGFVAGHNNTISGGRASVCGGRANTASGPFSSVSGGFRNVASGKDSSVSGGANNLASGRQSTVSGGQLNETSGPYSSVSGGQYSTASGNYSSVSGGTNNLASGNHSTVAGGRYTEASKHYSVLP